MANCSIYKRSLFLSVIYDLFRMLSILSGKFILFMTKKNENKNIFFHLQKRYTVHRTSLISISFTQALHVSSISFFFFVIFFKYARATQSTFVKCKRYTEYIIQLSEHQIRQKKIN